MRASLLFLLCVTIAGCSPMGQALSPTMEAWKTYERGEVQTAAIGSKMLRGGNRIEQLAFTPTGPNSPPDISSAGSTEKTPALTPGRDWIATRETKSGYVLRPPKEYVDESPDLIGEYGGYRLHITKEGHIGKGWLNSSAAQEATQAGEWPSSKLFKRRPAYTEGSFEFELLYTGRDGPNAQMKYREYKDDLQRAAFSQNLSYNLDDSKTISFRSLRLRILEATNSQIRFKVLEDGGLEWVP